MIQFTDLAKEKVKAFIQGTGKSDMSLRIKITERKAEGFKYGFSLEDYSAEMNDDIYVREGGFSTRIDPSSAKWLRGSTVDWVKQGESEGFSVINPNSPVPNTDEQGLKDEIVEAIKTIFDPEIPVNIYDLGLIYKIDIDAQKDVVVTMTLTAPNCPAAEQLPEEVRKKVEQVPSVHSSKIEITWEPPWDKTMMSEVAKLELGIS